MVLYHNVMQGRVQRCIVKWVLTNLSWISLVIIVTNSGSTPFTSSGALFPCGKDPGQLLLLLEACCAADRLGSVFLWTVLTFAAGCAPRYKMYVCMKQVYMYMYKLCRHAENRINTCSNMFRWLLYNSLYLNLVLTWFKDNNGNHVLWTIPVLLFCGFG